MPSRREMLVGISLLLTGCTGLQNGFNSGGEGDEIPSSDQIAGVFAVPLTEGYENEPITYHTDDRILKVTVLQTLIEMVVDSDIPPESARKRETSDDPELVSIVHIGQCIYCRLCEEVCPTEAIILTQQFEFTGDTKDELAYNMEQLKNVPWYKDLPDPLESREPDRSAWIGEGDGEIDYQ